MSPHRAERAHLPGDAAGGRPGWQDRITGAVDANERAKADRRGAGMRNWPARLTMVSDIEFRRLLRQAADARGMSATGYARRATAAFVASDLGLDFSSVCALLPKPSPPEGTMKGLPKEEHPLRHPGRWVDDGIGHGSWRVCPDD
jgi:hypothetical protein